ncbi:MAG: UvrD-helicase domain-containing protein [Tenericutes bacterium]|nr:UvrD-helicase domain-containing protein [Mycoplasmatota bacterium]
MKKTIKEDFKSLDKYQLKAVTSNRKKILVLAGAGSGKTYTIVSRIRYLIKYRNVKPSDILCISFTNDAVNKLKEDLNNKDVEVLTFHKLALKIIGRKKEVLAEDMLTDIIINTFSNDKLFGLYEMERFDMYNLVKTFINLFKSNNYSLDKFYTFINKANTKDKMLLKEIMKCYICYESYLNKEGLMDFNDMINIAINKLDKVNLKYKHIIIDEYQDTSLTKFLLIKKIISINKSNLFAVGDDFQSIYRFTGSNIKIITRFKKYFPFSKIIKLKYTYRNSKELVFIAGKFIMKNKSQIRKKMKSKIRENNPVKIIYYDDLTSSINKVIEKEEIDDLFVLSRNNKDLENINIKGIKYKKMSVHKSKGLQAKYVFLINVNSNKNGFPNKIEDHKILKYVNNYKEHFKYDEERRLFYVALTRCTKKIYLFVPSNRESIFIKEIKKYKKVNVIYDIS